MTESIGYSLNVINLFIQSMYDTDAISPSEARELYEHCDNIFEKDQMKTLNCNNSYNRIKSLKTDLHHATHGRVDHGG